MVVLFALLFIVIGFIAYLFFAPLYLEIDTRKSLYRIRLHWLIDVSIKPVNNSILLELNMVGLTKQIDLFSGRGKDTKTAVRDTEKRRKASFIIPLKKIIGVLKSFRVRKCRIRFDSGDPQLNGILYPLFYWVGSYSRKDVQISFTGENEILLTIQNNLARMSWAYISS